MSNENEEELLFPDRLSFGRNVLWIASVALVYFAMARLSLSFVFEPEGIAAIWPPSGIFLSAILLTRRSLRPWLVGTLFVIDLIAEILTGTSWLVSFLYALTLTGDAVLSAWLLLRFVGGPITFRRVRELIGWLVLSVLLSNALAGLVAATVASQLLPGTSFWNAWKWWMASDGIGNLVITPLVLSWAAWGRTRLKVLHPNRVLEGAALFILLAILNYFTVAGLSDDLYSVLLTYLTFPFLLWAALRFGVRGVASASLVLTAIVIYFSFNGTITDGLFFGTSLDVVITVQLFLAIMIMPSLFLATVVTGRHEAEEALRESEDKFKYVFDYSNVGKSITLPSGEIQVNKTFCEMLGYSAEELKNKRWQEITHPDDIELTQREMKGLLSGEKDAARFIKRFLRKDGSIVWVDIRSSLRLNQVGKPLYFMTTLADITERKQAEEAHRQSEERVAASQKLLQDFTDNSTSLIYAFDLDGKFLLINRSLEATLGFPRETLIGKTREAVMPPEIATAHRMNDLQVIARRIPTTFEEEARKPDGLYVYISVKFPLLDKDGNVYGVGGISTDITERKQFEKTLQESEARLVEAQAVAHIGSWEINLADKMIWASAEAFRIYGLSRTSPYLPLELAQRLPIAEDRPRLDAALQGLIQEQHVYNEEFHIRRANDGAYRMLNSIAHLVFDANGKPAKVIGVIQDITERKLTEEKIAEQMEELRRWHSVTLGREMRVLELKEEVNEILIRAGLPPRYDNLETSGKHE
jgi:PAS domain S-box-containing protein